MRKNKFDALLNKSKKEIINELGDGFNFYPDQVWYYALSRNWWGRRKILFVEFDEKGMVCKQYVKTVYFKTRL